MNPKVAIIVLNWNGCKDTIECLQALRCIDYDNHSLVLVDNASTDESLAKIDTYFTDGLNLKSHVLERPVRNRPLRIIQYTAREANKSEGCRGAAACIGKNHAISLIANDSNDGFAEGNNLGVAYALSTLNPDYVLLLNNDAVVDQHFLHELTHTAERDERIGLLQPKMLRYADLTIDNAGGTCDPLAYCEPRGLHEKDEGQYDTGREEGFFYVSGACMLIRRSVLEAFSGECFDPLLFAYYEDVDLSWMTRLIGFKVAYCPSSVCYHKGNAAFAGLSSFAEYLSHRNRIRVLIKNYSLSTLVFVLPFTLVLKGVVLSLSALFNLDIRELSNYLKALLWNVLNLRTTLTMRHRIQSQRKVGDKDVMHSMVPYSLGARLVIKQLLRERYLSP
ncbi:MAG: glycosyltransferase family 2 protein [Euryarchaeota archaeon]|nr:glycosyltransferase family 2 protein [Euryarchaeota archaeon]